jgi:hypothetical protein
MAPKKYWYPNGPRWFRDADPAFKNKLVSAEISKLPADQKTALTLQRICGHGMFVAAEKMGMGLDISKFSKLLDAAQRALEVAILEHTPGDATEWERKVCRGQTDGGGEWGCEFFNPELGKSIQEETNEEPLEPDGPEEIQVRAFSTPKSSRTISETKALSDPSPTFPTELEGTESKALESKIVARRQKLRQSVFQFSEQEPYIWQPLRENFQLWRDSLYMAECAKVRAEVLKKPVQAAQLADEFAQIINGGRKW